MSFRLRPRLNSKQDENCDSTNKSKSMKNLSPNNSITKSKNSYLSINKSPKKRKIFLTTTDLKEGDKVFAKSDDRTYKEAILIGKFSKSYLVRFKSGVEKIIEGTKMRNIDEKPIRKKSQILPKNKPLNATISYTPIPSQALNESTISEIVQPIVHNTRSSNRRYSILDRLESRGFSKDLFEEPLKRKRKSKFGLLKLKKGLNPPENTEIHDSNVIESTILDKPNNISTTNSFKEISTSIAPSLLGFDSIIFNEPNPEIILNHIKDINKTLNINNDNPSFTQANNNISSDSLLNNPLEPILINKISTSNGHELLEDLKFNNIYPSAFIPNSLNMECFVNDKLESENKLIKCTCGLEHSSQQHPTIQCSKCKYWQHTLCMDISPSLLSVYQCYKCNQSSLLNSEHLFYDQNYFIKNGMFSDPDLNQLCHLSTNQSIVLRNLNSSISTAYETIQQYKSHRINTKTYEEIFIKLNENLKVLEQMANTQFSFPTIDGINDLGQMMNIKNMLTILDSIHN